MCIRDRIDADHAILVNNRPADFNTLVYENFTVEWVADAREADGLTETEDTAVEAVSYTHLSGIRYEIF